MPACDVWSGTGWARTFNRQSVYRLDLDADGTDQWAAMMLQIDAIPDGTEEQPVTVYLPGGSYRIDGTVAIDDREWMIFDGEGLFNHYTDLNGIEAGHYVGTSARAHWAFNGSRDCTLRRLDIRGPNEGRDVSDPRMAEYLEDYFGEHGVAVQVASERILVESMNISLIYGDTIYVGGIGSPNLDITVRNIVGRYMGRQGMGIVLVDGLLVEDCDIQWGGRSGLDIEPNHDTNMVWNATFRRTTFGCQFYPWIVGGSGSLLDPSVQNILIEDCVAVNTSGGTGLLATPQTGHNITIRRHTDMRQRSVFALHFGDWSGAIVVEDCVVTSGPATPTTYGVVVTNSTASLTIKRNTFNGVSGAVGVGGADQLYSVAGSPSIGTITTCGNVWNRGGSNDGDCP